MKVRRLEPTGTKRVFASLNRGDNPHSFEWVEIPTYDESPVGNALRRKRAALGLSLREAARKCGVGVVDWSDLERGIAVPEDGWDEVFRRLTSR